MDVIINRNGGELRAIVDKLPSMSMSIRPCMLLGDLLSTLRVFYCDCSYDIHRGNAGKTIRRLR